MNGRWKFPNDPDCPEVQKFYESLDDPIMMESGCADEFAADFEKKHRADCVQCFQYGLANCDMEY